MPREAVLEGIFGYIIYILPHNADYVMKGISFIMYLNQRIKAAGGDELEGISWTILHRRGSEIMTDVKTKKKGKYLKEPPKRNRKRKKNMKVAVWAGVVVILTVVLVAMICGLQNRSVYQTIVHNGYTGTQEQWLASLVGEDADSGDAESAYELAVANGYKGTEAEWIETLIGSRVDHINASPYSLACENGFDGSLAEWLTDIADKPENLGKSDDGSQKTEYELACEYGYSGTFIEWLVSITHDRVFK